MKAGSASEDRSYSSYAKAFVFNGQTGLDPLTVREVTASDALNRMSQK